MTAPVVLAALPYAKKYPPLEVPSWGVALMFVGFLVFTLLWDKALHALEHRLQHRNKVGLLKVVAGLKEELLAMGLISLLLPFIEGYIMQLCVPRSYSHKAPGYNNKGWASEAYEGDAGNKTAASGSAYAGRHLLGVSPSADLQASSKCPAGYQKLYPVEAIHGIHIFIALTAIVHIVYACIAMLLCLWRVKRWQRWELAAAASPLFVIDARTIKSLGRNKFTHGAAAIINQFTLSVTQPIYAGLRRLMLEQLKATAALDYLPAEFPYFEYVRESMELSFTKIVGVSILIWACAIVQLVVPFEQRVWSLIAICSVCIALMLVAGAKLHSVVVHLAAHAHFTYGADAMGEHAAAIASAASGDIAGLYDDSLTPKDANKAAAGDGTTEVRSINKSAGTGPKLQRGRMHANLTAGYKEYAVRVKAREQLAHMFWFGRPGLLLWFYKLAYFQSAFCMTLVFYAFWKDNQFLPDRTTHGGQLAAFLIVLTVNTVLALFSSTSVLPVYALVQSAAPGAVRDAARFLESSVRHEEERAAAGDDAVEAVQDALRKMQSTARHMAVTAAALQEPGMGMKL